MADIFRRSEALSCYDVLHYFADLMQPRSYLEIGVREGASLCSVVAREWEIIYFVQKTIVDGAVILDEDIVKRINEAFTPRECLDLYLFDNWSFKGGKDGHRRIANLLQTGFNLPEKRWRIFDGDSKKTIPPFLETHKGRFDLVFVDGDHTAEGATADLENLYGRFKVLVFDDLYHPQHGYLQDVFRDYVRGHDLPSFTVGRRMLGVGVAFDI